MLSNVYGRATSVGESGTGRAHDVHLVRGVALRARHAKFERREHLGCERALHVQKALLELLDPAAFVFGQGGRLPPVPISRDLWLSRRWRRTSRESLQGDGGARWYPLWHAEPFNGGR